MHTGVHRDYHKPTDLPDRLDYEKLARESRWIEQLTRQLASDLITPRWSPAELGPGLEEVAAVRVLFDRVLTRPDDIPLTPAKRQRMEAGRDRLKEIAERGTMTADDRKWLVSTAQWALLNVF